jgi:hypothetical protein
MFLLFLSVLFPVVVHDIYSFSSFILLGPSDTLPRGEKLSASTSTKAKKGKEGKESRSSKGQAGSRPSSQQQFDSTKPNWILRVFSDATAVSELSL